MTLHIGRYSIIGPVSQWRRLRTPKLGHGLVGYTAPRPPAKLYGYTPSNPRTGPIARSWRRYAGGKLVWRWRELWRVEPRVVAISDPETQRLLWVAKGYDWYATELGLHRTGGAGTGTAE